MQSLWGGLCPALCPAAPQCGKVDQLQHYCHTQGADLDQETAGILAHDCDMHSSEVRKEAIGYRAVGTALCPAAPQCGKVDQLQHYCHTQGEDLDQETAGILAHDCDMHSSEVRKEAIGYRAVGTVC